MVAPRRPGLGFTVAENMYYFFVHFVGQGGASEIGGLLEGFFVRTIVGGPYSHVLMSGLTGMGLAYVVTRPDVARSRRLAVGIGLYLAGVAAHFVWNSPLLDDLLGTDPGPAQWLTWAAIKGMPFLVLLAVLVRVAVRRQHRFVREALADDVVDGLVTEAELDALGDLRARRAARAAARARKGVAGERLLARLQHAQVALAVAESGSAPDRDARLEVSREAIRSLRAQLDALPDSGGSGGAGAAGGSSAAGGSGGPG